MKNWKEYKFNVNGINFISKVDINHPSGQRINNLPEHVFVSMNEGAVKNLIHAQDTLESIEKELVRVNEGGTYAFILLGDN